MALTPMIRQLTILVTTLLAGLSAGAAMGFPSSLLYQLRRKDTEILLNLDTASWIGSIHGLAGIPGIIAPILMQWKGRKFTFIAACLLIIAGWAIAYIANNIATLLTSESLHGFGANILVTVSFDCVSEMITPTYRNNAVQLYSITSMLGFTIAGISTMFVYWRLFCIISCLPAIVAILIAFTWLESPLWLAYKNDLDKCKTNFTKLRGTDDFSVKELREVMAAHKETLSRNKVLTQDTVLKRFWLNNITKRDFIIPAFHVFLLLNHAYWSGAVIVMLYSIELISKSTQNDTTAFIGSIILNFILMIGAIVSSVLIRFFNNKPVILFSSCGATVCLLSVSIISYLQSVGILGEKSRMMLYFLAIFMLASSLGQSSVGYTMSAELMPVKHRGIGGALFVIYSCLLHATSLKLSPYLFVFIRVWGSFLVYALNSLVCGLLIWKYIPETKGKTLQEIEHFYSNGTFEMKLSTEEEEPVNIQEF